MRVLFVISNINNRGGTEILAFNLLDKLNEYGVEAWIISEYKYIGVHPRVLSFSDNEYGMLSCIKVNIFNKLCGNRQYDACLASLIADKAKSLNVDWIINHTYDLIGALPTLSGVRTAQIFNWSVNGYESDILKLASAKKWPLSILSRFSLAKSISRWHKAIQNMDRLIALTHSAISELEQINLSTDRIVVIPNPLMHSMDSNRISSLNNKNIAFVGRLSHEKGVMRLLRIWQKVCPILEDYTLSIYGEGQLKTSIGQYISDNALPRVKLMGFCANLEEIYCNADLCCVTSDTEGFGLVLIEAMYYGVPCISFDCPVSPKEIIADAGITVSCFDENAYANKMIELLTDRKKKERIQWAALHRAKDFYIDVIIEKWINVLCDGCE